MGVALFFVYPIFINMKGVLPRLLCVMELSLINCVCVCVCAIVSACVCKLVSDKISKVDMVCVCVSGGVTFALLCLVGRRVFMFVFIFWCLCVFKCCLSLV